MKKILTAYILFSLFCLRSALEMNRTALSEQTTITMYRFAEANFFVGLAMFISGVFLVITPVFINYCQRNYLKNNLIGNFENERKYNLLFKMGFNDC